MTALGMAGCVTAKGIDAIHNPGTDDISIKMFAVANVMHARMGARTITATGADQFETQDSWKELADIQELKNAFRNLRKAVTMIRPWDYSVEVLETWLFSNIWFQEELKGVKKAALVSDFIDYVLHENARNWAQEAAYLSAAEIQTHWLSFWCSRKSSAPRYPQEGDGKENKFPRGKGDRDNKPQRGGGRGGGRGGRGGAGQWRDNKNKSRPQSLPQFEYPITEANTCYFKNEI